MSKEKKNATRDGRVKYRELCVFFHFISMPIESPETSSFQMAVQVQMKRVSSVCRYNGSESPKCTSDVWTPTRMAVLGEPSTSS